MKRAVLLLLSLLLLISPVLAEEKVIHDAWHPYQDYFTIGEDYYEVLNDHQLDTDRVRIQTLLKRNQASYIITASAEEPDEEDSIYTLASEQCKAEGAYRYCVTDISFDTKNQARSDEAGRFRYGTHIKIYEEIPETAVLTITKEVAKPTLFYQEDTKVTVTIENTGTLKATNIEYNETLGEGLLVISHKDYDQRLSTKLKKTIPELYPGNKVTLSYNVQAIDYVNTSTATSSISYNNPDPSTVTKSAPLKIVWPYISAFSLGKTTTDINIDFPLTYTITNVENDPLEAVLSITLDQGILVKNAGLFEKQGNKLIYEGTIAPESATTLTADIYSRFSGTYEVSSNLEVFVNNYNFKAQKDGSYTVETDTITPSIVLNKVKMRSGEPVTIGFYLKNEDLETPFINIQGWAGSDFFNQTFTLEALAKNREENIIFKPYYPPTTANEAVDHVIAIAGTFQTQNGEQKSFYTERTITVIPKNMSILLTKTISPTSLKRGEEVTITIDVENVADSGTNFVQVRDEYDSALEQTFGGVSGESYLYPGEARQLYVYKLRVPYSYTKDNFSTTSFLTAKGQPFTKITKTVDVTDPLAPGELPPEEPTDTPDEPEDTPDDLEEPTKTPDEPDDTPDEPTDTTEERPGVFKRIIVGIAEFFANFFS